MPVSWCLLSELNKHSFHAVWSSADLYGNPEFLHNYANGPDGSITSAILFDILTLQRAGVQTHANQHTLKVSVHTTYLSPCKLIRGSFSWKKAHSSLLNACACICFGDLASLVKYNRVALQQKAGVGVSILYLSTHLLMIYYDFYSLIKRTINGDVSALQEHFSDICEGWKKKACQGHTL